MEAARYFRGNSKYLDFNYQKDLNHSVFRLDSGTLLQRYNPVPDSQGSATLHRSASLFSGYSAANRDNYLSVAVKFVSSTKDLVTVRIQKKADVNPVVDP